MKKKEEENKLHIGSQVRTLSLKFYDEQLPDGEECFIERIVAIDKKMYQVLAIKHNRDLVKNDNDPFEISALKPHWHVYLRIMSKTNKPQVKKLLELLGVVYRPKLDEALWNNKGVQTCRDFTTCVVYGLHKTPQAEADGKTEYDITEYVSNLTIEEIEQVMQGYKRLEDETTRPNNKTLAELAETAEHLGYELKDFDEWWHDLTFVLQSHSKMKYIKERYNYGVKKRIEEDNKVLRLCIFIQGEKDTGKTHAAIEALKEKRKIIVGGGGTGKYDKIKPTTEAIIIDDDTAPNLLNMTDNYMCEAYRRNSNNPHWCGQYFIITSNKNFEQYMDDCKISERHYGPLMSRFYICEVCNCVNTNTNHLYCTSPSKRGTPEDQLARKEMFIKFRDAFNESIKEYASIKKEVDYTDINGVYRKFTDEEINERNKQQIEEQKKYEQNQKEKYFEEKLQSMSLEELQEKKRALEVENNTEMTDEEKRLEDLFSIS